MLDKIKNITRGQLIVVIFIFICAISIYAGINIKKSNSIKDYKAFEKEVVQAGKFYYKLEKLELSKSEERRVNLTSLEKKNLISNPLKDKCKGYVIISNQRDIYTSEYSIVYTGYVKCGSYKSPGYVEE